MNKCTLTIGLFLAMATGTQAEVLPPRSVPIESLKALLAGAEKDGRAVYLGTPVWEVRNGFTLSPPLGHYLLEDGGVADIGMPLPASIGTNVGSVWTRTDSGDSGPPSIADVRRWGVAGMISPQEPVLPIDIQRESEARALAHQSGWGVAIMGALFIILLQLIRIERRLPKRERT